MPSSPRQRMNAAERRRKALALQLAGADLRAIAEQVGYATPSAAKTAIDRAIEESTAREKQSVDEMRQLEVLRLNRLQAAYWTPALKGDKKAADIVLKCAAARDRLQGLAAPTKVEHSGEITEYRIVGIDPSEIV